MQKLYKLTNQDGQTYNNYKYGVAGMVHKKKHCKNPQLCSFDVFHAYTNKNLAFLLNPIHAGIDNPVLWEIEGDVVCSDFGKVGSFTQKVLGSIEYPEWVGHEKEKDVRVMFAVLCAESVLHVYKKYSDDDRVEKAINAAREYLKTKNAGAAYVAVRAAADAAYAAANAYAADAYAAGAAAYAAADAAGAAARAAADAYAAADAAGAAARAAGANSNIDFAKLADKAVSMVMG